MIGVVQTGVDEGNSRAGVMIPVPGFSMYQARLLQHNSYQVSGSLTYYKFYDHSPSLETRSFRCRRAEAFSYSSTLITCNFIQFLLTPF